MTNKQCAERLIELHDGLKLPHSEPALVIDARRIANDHYVDFCAGATPRIASAYLESLELLNLLASHMRAGTPQRNRLDLFILQQVTQTTEAI